MLQPKQTIDRAGASYWQSVWRGAAQPRLVDPRASGVRNHVRRDIHRFLGRALDSYAGVSASPRLIEVGCGNSVWLPYFALEHGCRVAGLDYSEAGCASACAILAQAGVNGEVRHGDLWHPPDEWLGAFDIVFTNGLVEHFDSTSDVVAALARLLRPGGMMVTLVPNLVGYMGFIQRMLNRLVYDIHVPLSAARLFEAHAAAAMRIDWCGYVCGINFGVLNFDGAPGGALVRAGRRLVWVALVGISAAAWWAEEHGLMRIRPNFRTSPYIGCVGRLNP